MTSATWQPAPIQFPDAELLFTTALRAQLVAEDETDVFVGREVPNPRRDRMVIVNRDGGASTGVRDRPRLRVRVWDETDQKATDLARLVVALMQQIPGSNGVLRVEHQSGPYEVPDDSGQPQRYLLFEAHVRGTQLA